MHCAIQEIGVPGKHHLRRIASALSRAAVMARQARKVSPTVHACAMQPFGVNGGSPSKISPAVPSPAARMWPNIGSKKDIASPAFPYTRK
jgi:hypothetical protein